VNCEAYKCYAIQFNSSQVCNSNGACTAPDTCSCHDGIFGTKCDLSLIELGAQITADVLLTLNVCPSGTYKVSNDSTKASVCVGCPAGTYNPFSGATSIAACLGCPVGTFSTAIGANAITACQVCPSGK
jgi:hypothetical protein